MYSMLKQPINTNQCWSIKNFKSEYITVSITSKQNAGGDPTASTENPMRKISRERIKTVD
jgi:hypothetical protein